jgi:hypothetical protein
MSGYDEVADIRQDVGKLPKLIEASKARCAVSAIRTETPFIALSRPRFKRRQCRAAQG